MGNILSRLVCELQDVLHRELAVLIHSNYKEQSITCDLCLTEDWSYFQHWSDTDDLAAVLADFFNDQRGRLRPL
jgi:hypothetical protein